MKASWLYFVCNPWVLICLKLDGKNFLVSTLNCFKMFIYDLFAIYQIFVRVFTSQVLVH